MQTAWFTDNSAFEKLEAEWNDLLHRSMSDTLFLTWEWQSTWWRYLGTGNLCIITMREDDGALVGIVPFFWDVSMAQAKSLSLIGCIDVSDYLDAIVAKEHAASVYHALIDTITCADFPAWDVVHLCNLPAASPTNTELKAMAEARGFQAEWRVHDVSPRIELPATWEEYLAVLDKKQRHEIRRKLRRSEEVNARWYTVEGEDALNAAVADFSELHKKSQPDKHMFMDARMQKFFVEMARTLQARHWLQLAFLEIEGARAASLFSFVYRNDVLVYNSGYDPAKYGHLSPGVVLFARSIQDAIAAKRRVYDFLRGDEEYKYRFGAKNTNVYELHIRR